MLNVAILSALVVLSIVAGEISYHAGVPNFISRKIVHILSAVVAALMPSMISIQLALGFSAIFAVFLIFARKMRWLDGIFNQNEEALGAILFPVGIIIAAITFWDFNPIIFQFACLTLGFSDGLAGILGRTFGKIKYQISTEKTVEGSLVFFTTSLSIALGLLAYHGIPITPERILKALAVSLILTVSEAVFANGWDNIAVPFISGIMMVWVVG